MTIIGPPGIAAADISQAGAVLGSYPAGATIHCFINRGKSLVKLGAGQRQQRGGGQRQRL